MLQPKPKKILYMKKITYLVMLIVIQGYSQVLTNKNISNYKEELFLIDFFENYSFSKYGLKWGMNSYEAEGYLKSIEGTTIKNELAAEGHLFGIFPKKHSLQFENDKLRNIYAVFLLKENATPLEIQNFYYSNVKLVNEILNPANRVREESIREFFDNEAEVMARDVWVYNRGQSGVVIMIGKSALINKPVFSIIFTGLNDSDVVLTHITPSLINKYGVEATSIFSKKVGNPSVSYILMK